MSAAHRSDEPAPAEADSSTGAGEEVPAEPPPLLRLRDGLPAVVDTAPSLATTLDRVAAGTGPVALDAERASGYRYSSRAYLIQLRRAGSGTALIDPTAYDDLRPLGAAIGDAEWVLHASTQDLPCLAEVGLKPAALFDTELAARLLGHPRVGLATLVQTILGATMRKEHSAVDWSRRPLPEPWLEYAALDVEVLLELRSVLAEELDAAGKREWADQEFAHLLDFAPVPRADPWRRTSGIHRLRNRRTLAVVRGLWHARDQVAAETDVTPSRLLPDAAIIAAAKAMPSSRSALLSTESFHGRGARRYADRWLASIAAAKALPDTELPTLTQRSDSPPQARSWADRDPEAAARLVLAREAMAALSAEHNVPVENLLTPDTLRRVLWTPPADTGDALRAAVAADLARLAARPWQIQLTCELLAGAIEGGGRAAAQSAAPG